jgi:hypothetical protein
LFDNNAANIIRAKPFVANILLFDKYFTIFKKLSVPIGGDTFQLTLVLTLELFHIECTILAGCPVSLLFAEHSPIRQFLPKPHLPALQNLQPGKDDSVEWVPLMQDFKWSPFQRIHHLCRKPADKFNILPGKAIGNDVFAQADGISHLLE